MHTIIAAITEGRRYDLNQRCTHPFLDRIGGVVVTRIDTSSANGCSPVVEVRFDDRTKITTALSNVILCWEDRATAPAKPKAAPKRKEATKRKARPTTAAR